jgi:DNA polymerase-3 subunit beta
MERDELLSKLNLARPCLSTQDIVPILSHFCFREGGIIAFNGIQAIDIDYENDLECALPGELLIKLLGSYSSDKITIKKKGKEVAVKAGKSNAKLASLSEDDYIFEAPDMDEGLSFSLTEDFLAGIRKTLMSVSKNSLQRSQYGITFTSDKSGAYMYSTDNFRISRYSLAKPVLKKEKIKVLLPETFCQLLLDITKEFGCDDVEIVVGEDYICGVFEEEGVYLYSKLLLDVDFLDFDAILDNYYSEDDDDFQEVPEAFRDAIERTALLTAKESEQVVQLDSDDSILQVSANSAFGEIREDIAFDDDIAKKSLSFGIDANLLLGAIKVVDEMMLRPSIFIGKSENFIHLLMGFAGEE